MTTATMRPGPNSLLSCASESARRRHLAHGRRCHVCWPDSGLPAVPDTTAVPDWLSELIASEFGTDITEEFAA